MDETAEAYRRLAQLQGVEVSDARLGVLAATLAAQLASERAASRALEFEIEPASFIATLARGAQ